MGKEQKYKSFVILSNQRHDAHEQPENEDNNNNNSLSLFSASHQIQGHLTLSATK